MTSRFDRLTQELCAEIDTLELENAALRAELKEERKKYSNLLDMSLESQRQASGNMLMLSLKLATSGAFEKP